MHLVVFVHLTATFAQGAALHVHSDSNVPVSWVIANATYDDNLHVCGSIGETGSSFRYTEGTPAMPCPTGWQQVNQLRNATGTKAFDQVPYMILTMTLALTLTPTPRCFWKPSL